MAFVSFLTASVMIFLCIFLILLILIQRGKGGGLAGAFGGAGGQSAFGTKAGDTFMRITIVCSIIWFLLCLGASFYMSPGGKQGSKLKLDSGLPASTAPAVPGGGAETTIPVPVPTTTPTTPTDSPAAPASEQPSP